MIHQFYVIRLKIQAILCTKYCKQEYSKEALSWYNFNPKGTIIFPHDDKQIIFLTSMRNNKHNTMGKRKSLNITLSEKNNP